MNCKNQNQNLLLLGHGALSTSDTLKTLAHLGFCQSCRTRYDQLRKAGVAIINVSVTPSITPRLLPTSTQLLAAAALITAFVVMLLVVGTTTVLATSNTFASHTPPVSCSPGLPNDRCR